MPSKLTLMQNKRNRKVRLLAYFYSRRNMSMFVSLSGFLHHSNNASEMRALLADIFYDYKTLNAAPEIRR